MRSRTVSRCGLVYRPVRNPCARNNESIMRAADVLPLVPVMCTDGYARCGLPIRSSSASMRLRSATIRPAPRSSSSRWTRANSDSTGRVYGDGVEGLHSIRSHEPSQESHMTEPNWGAPEGQGVPSPDPYRSPPSSVPPAPAWSATSGPPEPSSQPAWPPTAPQYGAGAAPPPQYGAGSAPSPYGPPTQPVGPQSGPPNQPYGQPTYPTQDYGQQTGYPPQQYGQPGYGAPQAPYGYQPEPPRSSGNTLRIVLIVLIVLALGGVGTFLGIHYAGSSKPSAAPSTPSLATSPPASPSTTPSAAASGPTIYRLPATAAGLKLQPSSDANQQLAQALPDALAAQTTVGVYGDPADPERVLILIGAQTDVGSPNAALAGVFAGMATSSEADLGKPKKYDAGSMGGLMECASGNLSELGTKIPVGVCSVADSHGIILAI